MPELLLELFSEEIPARMQRRAADDLRRLVTGGLVDAGLTYEGAQAHVTPRRLVLSVEGLGTRTPDTSEERKGPRTDAPDKAIEGFLRSVGVSMGYWQVVEDKKGSFFVAKIDKPGRDTPDVLAELIPQVIAGFPWPKSMRWGSGSLRWVRPLQSILCCFDGEVVRFEVGELRSGETTRGHRFMGNGEIAASRFEPYATKLRDSFVMVDASERADTIRAEAETLAFAKGLKVVEDEGLVQETAGMVEWPVVLMGTFDEAFLDVPPEVIISSIKTHQKCFALQDTGGNEGGNGGGKPRTALANRYLLVSNLIAEDGGAKVINGNDRVIAARLADAKFFWDQDLKMRLEDRLPQLESVTFHAKLGTQLERAERLEALAAELATVTSADPEKARLAARLAKTDLVSGMVGEFPELQGIMGGYYARAEGLDDDIANAIHDHYKPQGPSDTVPTAPVSAAVSLAEKIDILVGFWAIGEKPTSSKDPYALRRAALGIIRIISDNRYRVSLKTVFGQALEHYSNQRGEVFAEKFDGDDLLAFFADRLKVYLRDHGTRHDLIDAVFSSGGQDDLLMIVKRVAALDHFLKSDDGQNLLAGVRRAANILKIEEKKDGTRYTGDPNPNMLLQGEEKSLAAGVRQAQANALKAVREEDFEAAMLAIAKLRQPIDDFFDHVTVNDKDRSLRDNRLVLLNRIRDATRQVADFSKIEG